MENLAVNTYSKRQISTHVLTCFNQTSYVLHFFQYRILCTFTIFFPKCHHISFVDFVVFPLGHGRSVTDFGGWEAHEAQLRCPYGVWVVIEEDIVPGAALNLISTNLPRPWSPRGIFPFKENSHGRAGNRTRDLLISSQRLWPQEHEAGHIHKCKYWDPNI